MRILLAFVALATPALAQNGKKPGPQPQGHPGVDQKLVDEAIRKGVAYLKSVGNFSTSYKVRTVELALWTLIHAGEPGSEILQKDLFDRMMQDPLERTYNVSLQAMILEKMDRVKHQVRIFHCAQFLVDNQHDYGQWGYGTPTTLIDPPKGVPSKDRAVATVGGKSGKSAIPLLKLPVKKNPAHKDTWRGDNSNSQYAALGLRACHDAGILLPDGVIQAAMKWWRDCQGVEEKSGDKKSVEKKPGPQATGQVSADPHGWSYSSEGKTGWARGKGSMTAGAVGGLAIYHYILGQPWRADQDILEGVRWMGDNFTVTDNPIGEGPRFHYYWLYGLERAGILYGTGFFGTHDWYKEGALYLLGAQKPDGSWVADDEKVVDTCFAILFLRRATRALVPVASIDSTPAGKK